METGSRYPINLIVDYPDRALNKLTTFFRIFTALPICFIMFLLVGMAGNKMPLAGFVTVPLIFMLVVRRKYPKWWYDWNLALANFSIRVLAYGGLLTDVYPSTDEDQGVHITWPYPDAQADLNRWLPLVKWLLAIPHYILLTLLYFAVVAVVIVSWFTILFTGRIPRDWFNFIVGVFRWSLRVTAYAFILTTDQYPPFTLSE